jgi:hypothetical protein
VRAKTLRTDGRSLKAIVADVNGTLRGWYGYFQLESETFSPDFRAIMRLCVWRRRA